MSEPADPNERPLRGPTGARRRARRARTDQEGAAAEPDPVPVAPPPAAETGPPRPGARKRATPPGPPSTESEPPRTQPRGMVCPNCGKYHDLSTRQVGDRFDCSCGTELTVQPPRGTKVTRPPEATLRLRELRTRHRLSMVSMLVAFAACIALLAATLYLLVTEKSYISGTCAGIAALGFLTVAVVATSEWRRTSAELAAENVKELP